jgi:hypothetical protein
LEFVRKAILNGSDLKENLHFALCFRKYLETGGDERTLPIINGGTDVERQKSLPAFRAAYMSALPVSQKWKKKELSIKSLSRIRQSDDPSAIKERLTIKRFFGIHCQDSGYVQQIPRM